MGNPFIDNWTTLLRGEIKQVDSKMLIGFMRWRSGNKKDLPLMRDINRRIFTNDPESLLWDMYFDVDRNCRFCKTPKRPKPIADKKAEIIYDALQKYYKWGKTELELNKEIINLFLLEDKEFIKWIAESAGLDKRQCKILGVEVVKFKVKKPKKTDSKSLFSF